MAPASAISCQSKTRDHGCRTRPARSRRMPSTWMSASSAEARNRFGLVSAGELGRAQERGPAGSRRLGALGLGLVASRSSIRIAIASARVISSPLATGVASTWATDSRYITPSGPPHPHQRQHDRGLHRLVDRPPCTSAAGWPPPHRSTNAVGSRTSRRACRRLDTTHRARRWSKPERHLAGVAVPGRMVVADPWSALLQVVCSPGWPVDHRPGSSAEVGGLELVAHVLDTWSRTPVEVPVDDDRPRRRTASAARRRT
jgi:hypothetical protein